MCEECRELQGRVKQLEAQVRKQQKLIKLAAKIIKRQKQQIEAVRSYTWGVICEAEKKMSEGGLPKTIWMEWKGRAEVAGQVFKIVWIDWASTFLEAIGKMQGL